MGLRAGAAWTQQWHGQPWALLSILVVLSHPTGHQEQPGRLHHSDLRQGKLRLQRGSVGVWLPEVGCWLCAASGLVVFLDWVTFRLCLSQLHIYECLLCVWSLWEDNLE